MAWIQLGDHAGYGYGSIPEEEIKDGWVDSNKFKPIMYDLIYVKEKYKKSLPAWWNGTGWEGLRVRSGRPYKYWKRQKHESNH